MYKQVIVVRKDLNMSPGKIAAQVAHASIGAWKGASERARKAWEKEGAKKVVLQANSREQLLELKEKAGKLPKCLITDAGMTEVPPGTETCLGLGPATDGEIDRITGSLKLLD